MDVAMVEQQESEEVTRTQNNSEQDSGIRKCEKKILGMERNRAKDTSQVRLK